MVSDQELAKAAAVLAAGRAAVFPTDTVYGLGVAVGSAPSPDEIYRIKRRDPDKAVPWLVGGRSALALYGRDVPDYAWRLAEEFWPGPCTLIVHASDAVPAPFAAQDATIALRMPDDECALRLIGRVGFPLATSSANIQGCPPPQAATQVDPLVASAAAAFIGDDRLRSGVSSTVVDCTGDSPRILRVGDISAAGVERAAFG